LLVSPRIADDTAQFIRDVEDNLVQALEDAQEQSDRCDQLLSQHQQHQESRMNSTLFLLTITTATFLPGQFLSSVYGMNFVYGDESSMPLMTDKNGFVVWVAIVAFVTTIALMAFCNLKRFARRRGAKQVGGQKGMGRFGFGRMIANRNKQDDIVPL
jgi:Mg2+ and Co2+ transporter CorA